MRNVYLSEEKQEYKEDNGTRYSELGYDLEIKAVAVRRGLNTSQGIRGIYSRKRTFSYADAVREDLAEHFKNALPYTDSV